MVIFKPFILASPIQFQIIYANIKVNELFYLLMEEKPVNINAQDEKGMTALHYAAIQNNYLAVDLLIQTSGIDINVTLTNLFNS